MHGEQFAIKSKIIFTRKCEEYPPIVTLYSEGAQCQISLYGAQVLSFIPQGSKDVLWLSKDIVYKRGKAIRGGIPLCFPWFSNAAKPSHGFARVMEWEVVQSGLDEEENPYIVLELQSGIESRKLFDYDFCAQLYVKLSAALELTLHVENKDTKRFSITEAMHSYFNLSHVCDVSIKGLENKIFIDSVDVDKRKHEEGSIMIDREVDRIYHDSHESCVIQDRGFNREIIITKENSLTTIVWNPWSEKSDAMDDFEEGGYHRMVCVESGNVGKNAVYLESGQRHSMKICIAEKLF